MLSKALYRIYVEEGPGGAMAHVAELPGCFAVGTDATNAIAATPRAIATFLRWLRSHGEPPVCDASIQGLGVADQSVVEIKRDGAPTVAGSRAALFAFDEEEWSDEQLERQLRWLGYSRARLLRQVEVLSNDELKARRVTPDRTLWDTLWHVANAEYGYIHRVAGPLYGVEAITDNEPSDVRERLAAIREIFVRRAKEVPTGRRGEIVYPRWANRPDEPWTLAKAVRRALEHELEHVGELQILASSPG
jgi:uncharacterized damage-inducible protein DinB/predicted RNase H-like HicB family nuclease